MDNKGSFGFPSVVIYSIITGIFLVVTVFCIMGAFAPVIIAASNNISNTDLPLAGLFSSNGAVLLIVMIMIFLALGYVGFQMLTS
jgi:hypothetical protein